VTLPLCPFTMPLRVEGTVNINLSVLISGSEWSSSRCGLTPVGRDFCLHLFAKLMGRKDV